MGIACTLDAVGACVMGWLRTTATACPACVFGCLGTCGGGLLSGRRCCQRCLLFLLSADVAEKTPWTLRPIA